MDIQRGQAGLHIVSLLSSLAMKPPEPHMRFLQMSLLYSAQTTAIADASDANTLDALSSVNVVL